MITVLTIHKFTENDENVYANVGWCTNFKLTLCFYHFKIGIIFLSFLPCASLVGNQNDTHFLSSFASNCFNKRNFQNIPNVTRTVHIVFQHQRF